MRAVVQRVASAKVEVGGEVVGAIGAGLLVYLGVGDGDDGRDVAFISDKIVNLRIFRDDEGRMNLSVKDVGGGVLVISQFTLYGDCRKGRRPSFDAAGEPGEAEKLYEEVAEAVKNAGLTVQTGVFGAKMFVTSENDGPVTLLLESPGRQAK